MLQYWQVITALYVTSSLLAGITGLLYIGLIKAPSLSLAEPLVLPSVAAAVIGGTSIFGGRGGYTGTIIGALIRADDAADDPADAGGGTADIVRADRAVCYGGLFEDCGGAVVDGLSGRFRPSASSQPSSLRCPCGKGARLRRRLARQRCFRVRFEVVQ